MQRFFFPDISLGKDIIIKEDSFVHQISRVLRSTIGESIVLFNGNGREYIYIINTITKKEISLRFEKDYAGVADSDMSIRLYQSLPNKYEKIEYILQKGTEVWIQEFIFFRSERSQHLAITPRKMERFQEIVREATEQCYGSRVPSITFHNDGIPPPQDGQSCIFHTEGQSSIALRDIGTRISPINIFVGPEGGWSPTEMSIFQERNMGIIHLWKRILRTETTGVVAAFFLIQK